jgi:ATP-binding protein involved in chromosome partitioning
MNTNASESEILQILAQVKHPEIDNTLAELGMLKDITVSSNKVSLTLLLPIMGIPTQIKDYLVRSIHDAISTVDASLQIELSLAEMSQDERTKFLKMSQEGWLG